MLLFGFSGVMGRLISLPSLELVWYRMGLAVLALLVYFRLRHRHWPRWQSADVWILLAGCVIAAHWVAFFESIKLANVTVGLTTVATGAFFGALLEPLFFRKRLVAYEAVLGLLVVGGVALIFRVSAQFSSGIVTGLIAALLSAVFSNINGKLAQKHSSLRITVLELGGGFLGLSLYLLLRHPGSLPLLPSPADWPYLLILAWLGTAFTFIESVAVMKALSPYTFLLTLNLEPIYGSLLALFIFGQDELMSGPFYLGGGIILFAIALNAYLKRSKK